MAEDIGKTLGLIFVLVVLIILTGFGIFQTTVGVPSLLSDTGFLSITELKPIGNFKDLTPPIWQLVVSGSTDKNRFYFADQDDINEELAESDATLTTDFKINVEINSQQCVYPLSIDKNSRNINLFDTYSWTGSSCKSLENSEEAISYAIQNSQSIINLDLDREDIKIVGRDVSGGFFGFGVDVKCYVAYKTVDHFVTGQLDPSYVRTQGSINLIPENIEKRTVLLDTEIASSGKIEDVGYYEWIGNTVVENCPSYVDNYRGTYAQGGKWRIISSDIYEQEYIEELRNFDTLAKTAQESKEFKDIITFDVVDSLIKEINEAATNALDDKESEIDDIEDFDSIYTHYTNPTELENALFRIERKTLIQNPQIKLQIEGTFLGVENIEPEGKIVSLDTSDFSTELGGQIIVEVKNTGVDDSTYQLSASCSQDFTGDSTANFGIRVGDTQKQALEISKTGITEKTCSYCNVDLLSQGNILDSDTIKICAIPKDTCAVSTYCGILNNDEVVYSCSAAVVSVKQTCDIDETCKNSACVGKTPVPTPDPIEICSGSYINWIWLDCDKCDSKLSTGSLETYCATKDYDLSLFTGLILGIVAFGFSFLYFNLTFKVNRTDTKIVLLILSLMLGFIAFILSSTILEHWIISLIVAILIIILGFVVKGFIPFL